ncbi:MAG TPA: hypothetical protein VFS40_11600 [Gemmatimonadales bacterium]|nr:hypothetical protein [Gemmatimonadales bacterium]
MLLKQEFGPEVPCAQCQRRVPRIRWGELCPDCRRVFEHRAARLAQRVALVVTVLVALVLRLTLPRAGFFWLALGVVGSYLIARRLAAGLALEFLPREPVGTRPEGPTPPRRPRPAA